ANPRLKPERVATLETSIEQHLGRTDLSLSVYRNWIRDLVDTAFLDSTGTFGFVNQDHVVGSGAEGEVGFVSSGGMRGRVAPARQRSEITATHEDLSNSPRWNGHLVLTQPGLGGPGFAGLGVRWLSARSTLRGTRLASVMVADVRTGLRMHGGFEGAVEVRNLLNAHYSDPAASEHVQDAIGQDGRGVFVTLGYRRAGY